MAYGLKACSCHPLNFYIIFNSYWNKYKDYFLMVFDFEINNLSEMVKFPLIPCKLGLVWDYAITYN